MTILTLLTKIKENNQLKQIHKDLKTHLGGLKVKWKFSSTALGGWVQISLLGEDEGIAANYIMQKIGLCPSSLDAVKKISPLKGYIHNIGSDSRKLFLDVGVFQPEIVFAIIPLTNLQRELAEGRNVTLGTIADLFAFCEGLPVEIKVDSLDENKTQINASLSSEQINRYQVWRESLLQRLLVVHSSLQEIEMVLKHSKLYRDVIDIESFSFFAHVLTCKLGTDAAGVMPKIGKKLKNARFSVFNPILLRNFLKK